MSMESHIVSGNRTLCGLDATGNMPEKLSQKVLGLRCSECARKADPKDGDKPRLFLGLF